VKQGSRHKLSIVSVVNAQGELYFNVNGHDLTVKDTVRSLRKLFKELSGRKIWVVWDGADINSSKRTGSFLEKNNAKVVAKRFPVYAPELNPDESVSNFAKYTDLANWCTKNKIEMRRVIT
jgi:hypothetical protein